MSLEAAHLEVAERNALRRGACLPLLDVSAEVRAALYREQVHKWEKAAERHHDEFVRLHYAVVEEYQLKSSRHQPSSVFVGQSILYQAHQQFVEFLAQKGHKHPRDRSTGAELARGTSHAHESKPSLRPDTGTVQADGR